MNIRKYLFLGPAKEGMIYASPVSRWLTVDRHPDSDPDVLLDIEQPKLAERLNELVGKNQYELIFAHRMPFDVISKPEFIDNLASLAGEKGIVIFNNLPPSAFAAYQKKFPGYIISFANVSLFTKTPLSFRAICEVLDSVNGHEIEEISALHAQIGALELDSKSDFLAPLPTRETLQLLACYKQLLVGWGDPSKTWRQESETIRDLRVDLSNVISGLRNRLTCNTDFQPALVEFLNQVTTRSLIPWLEHTSGLPEDLYNQFCENTPLRSLFNFLGVIRTLYPWVDKQLKVAEELWRREFTEQAKARKNTGCEAFLKQSIFAVSSSAVYVAKKIFTCCDSERDTYEEINRP